MIKKTYQRRYLRAPLRETLLYIASDQVSKTKIINISEGGVLIEELPFFPSTYEVPVLLTIPQIPTFNNFELLKMQAFSKDMLQRTVIRARVKMVRRDQLSVDLKDSFQARFGLEFVRILPLDQKIVEDYVSSYASNLVYLQMLIDSYNTDDDTRIRTKILSSILGYEYSDKISQLRSEVIKDYKGLQWL